MANSSSNSTPTSIRFSFKPETGREWYWTKVMHLNGRTLEDAIDEYLEQKKLPFEELTRKDIKWRIA